MTMRIAYSLFLIFLFATISPASAQVVDITVIDVGQGESILIEFPQGRQGTRKRMLIDGGRSASDENAVMSLLEDRNIDSLDVVVLTHPHDDHFSGLTPVMQNLDVDELWWTGEQRGPPRDATVPAKWGDFVPTMINAQTVTQIQQGLVRTFQRARIEVLNSGGEYPDTNVGRNINNDSIVMMLSFLSVKVLFTGDIETEEGDDLVSDFCSNAVSTCRKLNVDILKIPHHGSHHFSDDFVRFVDPEIVLISAGHANRQFHHPRADSIDAYVAAGAETILSTSTEGANHLNIRIGPGRGQIDFVSAPQDFVFWRALEDGQTCTAEEHGNFCLQTFDVE